MSSSDFRYRLPREEPTEIEDDTAHLWAISYADFLMVLLSFFILFFSISEDERDNLIKYLAKTPWPEAQPKISSMQMDSIIKEGMTNIQTVAQNLKDLNISVTKMDDNQLVLKFPDNIYSPGSTILLTDGQDILDDSLNRLKKYWHQLEFTFIGHVDSLPLTKSTNDIIANNYDLSALRASRALQFALVKGIPSQNLISEGWGSKRYNSRSLSLKIKLAEYKARKPAKFEPTHLPPSTRPGFQSYPIDSY